MYPIEMHIDEKQKAIVIDDPNYCQHYLPYSIKGKKNSFYAVIEYCKYKNTTPCGETRKTEQEAVRSLFAWLSNSIDPKDTIDDWQ